MRLLSGACLAITLLLTAPPLHAQPRARGAPPKGENTLIVPLPPEAPDSLCQAETISDAFARLGALATLPHVTSGIADAAPGGIEALARYCTQQADECATAADALRQEIGETPPSCSSAPTAPLPSGD